MARNHGAGVAAVNADVEFWKRRIAAPWSEELSIRWASGGGLSRARRETGVGAAPRAMKRLQQHMCRSKRTNCAHPSRAELRLQKVGAAFG